MGARDNRQLTVELSYNAAQLGPSLVIRMWGVGGGGGVDDLGRGGDRGKGP